MINSCIEFKYDVDYPSQCGCSSTIAPNYDLVNETSHPFDAKCGWLHL